MDAIDCTCEHRLEYHPPLATPGRCVVKDCPCEGFEEETDED